MTNFTQKISLLQMRPSVSIRKCTRLSSEEVFGDYRFRSGLLLTKPVLHMNSNSIQIQSTSAMKSDHLPFCCSRSEIGSNLFSKWPILPPGGVQGERFHNLHPVIMVDGAEIATDAIQDFIGVIKFDLQK